MKKLIVMALMLALAPAVVVAGAGSCFYENAVEATQCVSFSEEYKSPRWKDTWMRDVKSTCSEQILVQYCALGWSNVSEEDALTGSPGRGYVLCGNATGDDFMYAANVFLPLDPGEKLEIDVYGVIRGNPSSGQIPRQTEWRYVACAQDSWGPKRLCNTRWPKEDYASCHTNPLTLEVSYSPASSYTNYRVE